MNTENIILIVFSSIGVVICIHSGICAYLNRRQQYITDKDLTKELIEEEV
jgi:hypothetical protein